MKATLNPEKLTTRCARRTRRSHGVRVRQREAMPRRAFSSRLHDDHSATEQHLT
jgi:hypothetical protein